jgi:hypothetical protein
MPENRCSPFSLWQNSKVLGKLHLYVRNRTKVEFDIENIHTPTVMYKHRSLDTRCSIHCNGGFLDPLMTFG